MAHPPSRSQPPATCRTAACRLLPPGGILANVMPGDAGGGLAAAAISACPP